VPSLIDRFLPLYDAEIVEETSVAAGKTQTFAAVTKADISQDSVVRTLGGLGDLPDQIARRGLGFEMPEMGPLPLGIVLAPWLLDEEPGVEVVYGLAVRVDGLEPRIEPTAPGEFESVEGPGLVKAVVSVGVSPEGDGETTLRATVRARRPGVPDWLWGLASSSTRIVLRRSLALIKAEAERS
jgi:hypothetical protein